MSKVIGRIDAPRITSLVMGDLTNAVDDRVAHIHVRRRHVDLSAQNFRTRIELTPFHTSKQVEILFDSTFAIWAVLTRLGQSASIFARFFGVQVTDIGFIGLDQLNRPVVQLVKVIRRIVDIALPLITKPGDVVFDRINEFLAFFLWVGVIETQVTCAIKLFGNAEVEADRFRMADMEITIWLWRESGLHRLYAPGIKVFLNDFGDEIITGVRCRISHIGPYLYRNDSRPMSGRGKRRYYTRRKPVRDTRTHYLS